MLQYMMVDSDGRIAMSLEMDRRTGKGNDYLRDPGVDGIAIATTEKDMSTGDEVLHLVFFRVALCDFMDRIGSEPGTHHPKNYTNLLELL